MNWSVFTRQQKQMVIGTLVVALLLIIVMVHFLGLTKPAAARGGAAKAEIVELEKKIEAAQTLLLQEVMISRELNTAVKKLEELSAYVPAFSDRYAWAYEHVSRCAAQAKVVLDSLEEVQFMGDAAADASKPYEITVSTRCGYNQLVEFLRRLETGNPLLKITEMTMDAMPDSPDASQVRVRMQWPASIQIERGEK